MRERKRAIAEEPEPPAPPAAAPASPPRGARGTWEVPCGLLQNETVTVTGYGNKDNQCGVHSQPWTDPAMRGWRSRVCRGSRVSSSGCVSVEWVQLRSPCCLRCGTRWFHSPSAPWSGCVLLSSLSSVTSSAPTEQLRRCRGSPGGQSVLHKERCWVPLVGTWGHLHSTSGNSCKRGGILQFPDNLCRYACIFVDKYGNVHLYVQQVQNLYLTSNG